MDDIKDIYPNKEILEGNLDKPTDIELILENIKEFILRTIGTSGRDPYSKQIRLFSYYKQSFGMVDEDHTGFVFITRPHLNLMSNNLRRHSFFSLFDSLDPYDVKFAIRCWLDPFFANHPKVLSLTNKSPLYYNNCPFIPILTNRCKSLTGWPDIVLDTSTSDGGFFCEDITTPLGWDELNRSYDLSATFVDIKGGFVLALFLIWVMWIHYAKKGLFIPYLKYINEKRMCFTVSIYRFLLDKSKTYITKWAKATGCFPTSVPIGAYFNFDSHQPTVLVGHEFSVNFKVAGKIEYLKPEIIHEFNMLIKRYCSNIEDFEIVHKNEKSMYAGALIPWIDTTKGRLELHWKVDPELKALYT